MNALGRDEVRRAVLGDVEEAELCNIRALLPLDDGGVLVVEYIDDTTLRMHRFSKPPGV